MASSAIFNRGKEQEMRRKSAIFSSRFLLNAFLVFMIAAFILACRLPVFSGPLYCANGLSDFGTVKAGQKITQKFVLRNLHPWPVTIMSIPTGCGCTAVMTNKTLPVRLLPLQSLQVNISVEAGAGRNGVNQTINVLTSKRVEDTVLVLRAKVE